MRCVACDARLTLVEATRKSEDTDEYLDLCNTCFRTISDVVNAHSLNDDNSLDLLDKEDDSSIHDQSGDFDND
jgi:hypothetical protein